MRYELYYWPTIQGRGEFIRLALECAGADYIDVTRRTESSGMGVAAMMRLMDVEKSEVKKSELKKPDINNRNKSSFMPFAPPFLKAGDLLIAQTANILFYLGPKLGLAGDDETSRFWMHQLQLTIADFVSEVHDTHHPIAGSLYYEDQKPEAKKRAADFIQLRLPKFLDYFERVIECNQFGDQFMVGAELSYVDLSIFQIIAGLRYAFPHAMKKIDTDYPKLLDLHNRVAKSPPIARYLKSARRVPFNNDGIFRHYKELDN